MEVGRSTEDILEEGSRDEVECRIENINTVQNAKKKKIRPITHNTGFQY